MKPRATVLILALSWAAQIIATDDSLEKRNEDEGWGRFTAKAEAREDAGPSLVNGDTEEEEIETTTKSLITGRFGVYRPVHQSTEIETYRDVCTGYIEGMTGLLRSSRLVLLMHSRWRQCHANYDLPRLFHLLLWRRFRNMHF